MRKEKQAIKETLALPAKSAQQVIKAIRETPEQQVNRALPEIKGIGEAPEPKVKQVQAAVLLW
ncbi:hypothetical protein [Methylobacter sp.]|uniref:hypothetical protein n=1 Tax=Methylobacter sp. TaxID=2051955 RepID=UPI002FDCF7B2